MALSQYDEKVARLKTLHEHDTEMLTSQLRALEEQFANRVAELERKEQKCAALEMEKAGLCRDVELWKSQQKQGVDMREQLERDVSLNRQEWQKEGSRLRDNLDDATRIRQTLEHDMEVLATQFHDFKRQAQERESAAATAMQSMEEALRQRELQLADATARLVEQSESK